MKPLIVINFKNYEQGYGIKGYKIGEIVETYDNIIVCVPDSMISVMEGPVVYAQHVDPVSPGAHTGSTTAEEIKEVGAEGSLVNHSEKRIPFKDIKTVVEKLKKHNLKSIVCCQDKDEASRIKRLEPDYIAYEPPKLIGGKISVSEAKPEMIKEIVNIVKPVKLLVGAGVKTRKDVKKSMELGAVGVLIASGVLKSDNPKEKIKELAEW